MWKIVSDDVLSQIENGKSIRFISKESFIEFVNDLGQKTGLFVDEDIYVEDLVLSFNVKQDVCRKKGYNYGSIELTWSYIIEKNANPSNIIIY